jgi:hypothetical protein
MAAELIPGSTPQGILNLIQTNWLVRQIYDALRPFSYFRQDARSETLQPGTGQTATYSKLGVFNVDLAPLATALATPPLATFSSEQYTARPEHYANSFAFDGMTAYTQIGSSFQQGVSRLGEWAGRTQSRKARQAIFKYGAGTAYTRRAQVTTNTVLLLNTLAGFRHANTVSGLVPVSSTTPLDITIGGTANTVTGVTPINPIYPDGPGAVTLGTALAGNVAAQTQVLALNGPKIFRPNARTTSETIIATDNPTVQDLMSMRTRMFDLGIPKFALTNSYHLHADAAFMQLLSKDDQWKTSTQGMGPSDAFGVPGGTHLPLLGLTLFETNDAPAVGRGEEVAVGSLTGGPSGTTGVEPSGAAGAPGSSSSMRDLGLDLKNSSGIPIRRAVMTGANAFIDTSINIMDYWEKNGVRKIADVSSYVGQYQMSGSGMQFFAFEIEGWICIILPALDPRQLQTTITVARTFDYTLDTDLTAAAGGNNGTALNQNVPLKRAAVMEYSFVGA